MIHFWIIREPWQCFHQQADILNDLKKNGRKRGSLVEIPTSPQYSFPIFSCTEALLMGSDSRPFNKATTGSKHDIPGAPLELSALICPVSACQ
ncbi:hypothetical protein scyTo_0000437 [Scyliorhinus torazame]|uniref:Uncharacterized protein n=1 Tax=Scyliorhinus torazame TaxID=75743 RepID=A0A401NXM7_SCYTO|nr:hypothetical protein [Scyliorhinus torazame]